MSEARRRKSAPTSLRMRHGAMMSYSVRPQNLQPSRPTMTPLSGSRHGDLRNFTGLSRLARTSLVIVGVMALGSTGCLITERPDFDPPRQVGPFLTNLSPSPAAAQVIAY